MISGLIVTQACPAGVNGTGNPSPSGSKNEEAVREITDSTIELSPLTVKHRAGDLLGLRESASSGFVGQEDFKYRPLFRNGELLEVIPGMVATQHSGSGKANQFFLRGFNLDHGTDFSTFVDGVPFNLRTHGHGQGYLDLNSIIPELVDYVEFGKGPYYTQIGDFSSAGFSKINTVKRLAEGLAKFEIGTNDFYRLLLANSTPVENGDILYGGEFNFYDGPWVVSEDLKKYKGLLKYSGGNEDLGYSVAAKAYYSRWTATNQIPRRAVQSGRLSRLDAVDPSDGGQTQRYSFAADWWRNTQEQSSHLNAYAFYYDLKLWTNSTYFLDNPERGDQIEQVDRRVVLGGEAMQAWFGQWQQFDFTQTLAIQVRYDHIPEVSLSQTQNRSRFNEISRSRVDETSVGVYTQNETRWTNYLRTTIGIRGDFYWFDVKDRNIDQNSGSRFAAIASPKFSLVLGPWHQSEFFVNAGTGFHSNDARGTTASIDPLTEDPASPVPSLVRSLGGEIGLRTNLFNGYTGSLALWYLKLDSELVFAGDSASTEPSGKSQRYGVEWTNFYQPLDWLTLDADLAFTHAEFLNTEANLSHIPNSVAQVITLGATVDMPWGLFGALRMRYFNDIPLTEDGSVEAPSTMIWNMKLGYRIEQFSLSMDIFNLFDAPDNDITYFYRSRLQGEPAAGFDDIHFHPVEPRQFRFTLAYQID